VASTADEPQREEPQPEEPQPQPKGPGVGLRADITAFQLERLAAFYAVYCPAKRGEAERMLAKYRGREPQLFAALVAKFGPEPVLPLPFDATDLLVLELETQPMPEPAPEPEPELVPACTPAHAPPPAAQEAGEDAPPLTRYADTLELEPPREVLAQLAPDELRCARSGRTIGDGDGRAPSFWLNLADGTVAAGRYHRRPDDVPTLDDLRRVDYELAVRCRRVAQASPPFAAGAEPRPRRPRWGSRPCALTSPPTVPLPGATSTTRPMSTARPSWPLTRTAPMSSSSPAAPTAT
jgi:hypothetical protein